jgi:C1A family cysteine protease
MSMNQTEFFSISSSSSSSLSSLSTWKSSFFKSRISLAKTGVIDYSDLSTKEKEELFSDFKKTYKKEYQTEHLEEKSFENFSKFLKTVDKRNKKEAKKGGSAIHGVTIFADLSDDDFASSHLGFRETDERRMLMRSLKDKHKHSSSSSHKPTKQPTHKPTYSPTSKKGTYKNWAEDGFTTSVRDQGYCGSCWAISAVEQMESDAIISGLMTNKESLSVQQVVSCDRNDYGCHGGNTEVAYTYIGKTGGLQLETTYPYTSYYDVTGHCKYSDAKAKISLHGYHTLDDEDAMQDYVLKNGPLSVCLAASSWSSYQSGVVSSCDKAVDHCVQVVGVNTEDDYWIIRNSW